MRRSGDVFCDAILAVWVGWSSERLPQVQAALPSGNQLWLEGPGAVASDGNFDLTLIDEARLRARPVAAGAIACRIALLLARMVGRFRPKHPRDKGLLQQF